MEKRPWYKKGWGIALLIIGFIVLVYLMLIGILSYNYTKDIRSGIQDYEREAEKLRYDYSQRNEEIARLVETPDDPHLGPQDASITIVEFYDFNCPHCRAFYPTLRRLSVEYKDTVHFILKDMPVITDDSEILAQAAECAHDQDRFWEFHDKAFARANENLSADDIPDIIKGISINQDQFYTCIESGRYEKEVAADLDAGLAAGVTGTPTLFINGHKISGEVPYDILKRIIDTSLNKK